MERESEPSLTDACSAGQAVPEGQSQTAWTDERFYVRELVLQAFLRNEAAGRFGPREEGRRFLEAHGIDADSFLSELQSG